MELLILTILQAGGTQLAEYGILGVIVIALSLAVKVLYTGAQKRERELENKLLDFSNKSIEINEKTINALQNNTEVMKELRTLFLEHILKKLEDTHEQSN